MRRTTVSRNTLSNASLKFSKELAVARADTCS